MTLDDGGSKMKLRRIALLVFGAFVSVNAYSGALCNNCKISRVGCTDVVDGKQTCRVAFTGTVSGQAICSGSADELIVNVASDGGKAMLSVALTALATDKNVIGVGTGMCSLWTTYPRETMEMLYIVK